MTVAGRQLEADDRMLDRCGEEKTAPCFRTWTTRRTTVVVGIGQSVEREVFTDECAAQGVEIVKRRSGGGAVVIGPGTLQYAFVLPNDDRIATIDDTKRFCNALLLAALDRDGMTEDPSGDLLLAGKKVGGLALRRRRLATLLHGTLITEMAAKRIAALLRHPTREPAYRAGRSHSAFLSRLGFVDAAELERRVRSALAAAYAGPRQDAQRRRRATRA